jgi:hypothetical protein
METAQGENKMVYMLLPNGEKPIGGLYDGYGRLVTSHGKVEIYEKLAEINGYSEDLFDTGLKIFHGEIKAKYPLKLSFNPRAKYESCKPSKSCPNQGYWGAEEVSSKKKLPKKQDLLKALMEKQSPISDLKAKAKKLNLDGVLDKILKVTDENKKSKMLKDFENIIKKSSVLSELKETEKNLMKISNYNK